MPDHGSRISPPALLVWLTITLALAAGSIAHGATPAPSALRIRSSTGLDDATLALVNRGDWRAAIERLEAIFGKQTSATTLLGWQSFGYMFQNRCSDLNALSNRVTGEKATTGDEISAKVVKAMTLTCENKLDEAQKVLDSMPASAQTSVLANFARAAVSGKRGQPAKAIELTQKSVELAPDFAWGFRTLGVLQDRWMKDSAKAEAAFEQALAIEPNAAEVRDKFVDLRLSKNDFDGAIDVALSGIKAQPRQANNYYRLAQIYIQQWRLKEALKQLDRAISLDPGDARFYRSRASILRHQGKLNEAVAEQQRAVDLSKDKGFELVALANLNLQAGNSNRAAESLREALKLDPDNQPAHAKLAELLLQEKRFDDLAEEYRRAITRKPKLSSLRLGLARALKLAGKTDEAIKELKEVANLGSNDPQPHRELGAIYIGQQEYAQAAREYTRALNINPSSGEDLVALGFCYAQNGDFMQAEAAFVTAMALQQLSPGQSSQANKLDVMRSLAVLLLDEGRYADAATQLEGLVAFSQSSGSNSLDRFLLLQAKSLRDRSEAAAKDLLGAFNALTDEQKKEQRAALVQTLLELGKAQMVEQALSEIPENQRATEAQWLVFSAQLLRLKGDLPGAEKAASDAVALKGPDNSTQSEACQELGRILLAKGDTAGATTALNKSIELNTKAFPSYEVLGRIYLKAGDSERAIEAGKKALEINPYYTRAYLLIGDAHFNSNRAKEALAQYQKAVDTYPGWLDAHKALLNSYRKLSLKEEIAREEESIAQIEKRNQ